MEEYPKSQDTDFIKTATRNGVRVITMNRPEKLNGWTMGMMDAYKAALSDAAQDESVGAVIFTGTGRYYSAGVNLAGTIKLMHPKKLKELIFQHNQQLFEAFLYFPKPILVAVNGPAIGASVTSATLCDGIIASESATFSTPFARLGVTPEGCSSVHFPRLMGKHSAERMLGEEGWQPTAAEALEVGLIQWVAPDDKLLGSAQEIAEEWVVNGKPREFLAGSRLDELAAVNVEESRNLAEAFLGSRFLNNQMRFLWRKKKRVPAAMFFALAGLRPLWSRML
jgi:enoyl-CoA hydratase/carnithine racemase